MSELLEKTSVFVKSKRLEKKTGQMPSKVRLSKATKISLQKNIDYNFLDKAINKLNTIYSELISAVEIAEQIKAEEEARNKIAGSVELESKIEADEKVSKMTEAAIVNKRIKRVTIELLKLAGRIGTYKDNYGINVKKGFTAKSPRAINVQQLYANVYKSIMNKIDLYKMAEKKALDVSESGEVVAESDVPNWRKLFDNMSNIPSNVTVAMNKTRDEEEEVEFVQPSSSKITEEDLSYRKMLGQLGDEFELIESYEKSANGVPSQFKDGFETRKQNLSKIFFDLTGIETKNKASDELVIKDNTEFQNLIDQVNGYKDPLSEEDHKKMEDSLNEYYSRDDVASKISELTEKDVLYTFNQHMDDVIKAEIKENNKDAVDTVVVSNEDTAVNQEELEQQRVLNEIKAGAAEQARMLKTLYDYMDMRDKFEEEKEARELEEKQALLDGAEEQARILHDRNVVIDAAQEEAQRIVKEQINEAKAAQMSDMIASSAKQEAQRIVNDQLREARQEQFNNMIVTSAQEEANRLYAQNIIFNGAEEQAKMLNAQNMIIDGAEEQARIIYNAERKEQNEALVNGAKEQAKMLSDQNMIIDGAEEQARIIYDAERKEQNEALVNGAKAQAMLLNDQNMIIDGAEEQARKLQQQNEYLDIAESADVQARILLNKDKKSLLLEEAKELSERLKNITEEANKIDQSIAKSVDEDVMDNTFNPSRIKTEDGYLDPEIIDSAEVEAKRLYENNVIADSAMEEAQKLLEKNIIADSAEQEARRINTQNIIEASAEVEAKRLYENNVIADSAMEEAKKLHEKNIIADSAEQEAQRIVQQSMFADSAQEEAKRLYEQNIFDNIANQKASLIGEPTASQTPVVNPVPVEPIASQTPVVAPIPVAPTASQTPVANPVPVVNTETTTVGNLQLLDNNDRYGELTNRSNALLVKKARIDNISSRVNSSNKTINKKKEMLTTLKEELETGNYSFLQRSENIDDMIPNTKAA